MTVTFPRERNGWPDDGAQIPSTAGQKCPNCGSRDYRQTVSTESCPACGLHCDYWGGGANEVYKSMMARNERLREEQVEQSEQKDGWRFCDGETTFNDEEMRCW